jgi:phage baseplate assembly protein W
MSTKEKALYKQIEVKSNTKNKVPPTQRSYKGISTANSDNTSFTLHDIALIKQDIINHFHISQGEKLENPEFGTIIWDALHEPLTDELKEALTKNVTEIINYDPRVQVNDVVVTQYESGLQIECDLTYLPYNITESMRLKFDEEAGLIN